MACFPIKLRHTALAVSFLVFAAVVLVFSFSYQSFAQTASTPSSNPFLAQCGTYQTPSQVPKGYGSPVSFFGGGMLIKGFCFGDGEVRTIVGNGSRTTYVYENSFYWDGTAWRRVSLTGIEKSGVWFRGSATTSLPLLAPSTYYVAYVCEWAGGAWRCGCTGSACDRPQWQLQKFSYAPSSLPARSSSLGKNNGGFRPFLSKEYLVFPPETPISKFKVKPGDLYPVFLNKIGRELLDDNAWGVTDFLTLFTQLGWIEKKDRRQYNLKKLQWKRGLTLDGLGIRHKVYVYNEGARLAVSLIMPGYYIGVARNFDESNRSEISWGPIIIPSSWPYDEVGKRYGDLVLGELLKQHIKIAPDARTKKPGDRFTTDLSEFKWDKLLPGQFVTLRPDDNLKNLGVIKSGDDFSSLRELGFESNVRVWQTKEGIKVEMPEYDNVGEFLDNVTPSFIKEYTATFSEKAKSARKTVGEKVDDFKDVAKGVVDNFGAYAKKSAKEGKPQGFGDKSAFENFVGKAQENLSKGWDAFMSGAKDAWNAITEATGITSGKEPTEQDEQTCGGVSCGEGTDSVSI